MNVQYRNMNRIREIITEETSDPFESVPNEILFDFLNEFEGEYDENMAERFCKYLSINPWRENTGFFRALIEMNKGVSRPEDIVKPKIKTFEVIFKVKEKLWVKYDTSQTTTGYHIQSVEEEIYDGNLNAYDGDEVYGSRDIYDSEFIDESFEIDEI